LPFRLTSNFVDLMGARASGLYGLFAGVLTACSLAMGKYHEKLLPLLNLVFRDDLNDDKDGNLLLINKSLEYIKFKMCSLSQHKQILNMEQYLQDPEYVKLHRQLHMMKLDPNFVDQSAP
jgi:phosphatidylinositol kinase/protein kinase (PI-3  family)